MRDMWWFFALIAVCVMSAAFIGRYDSLADAEAAKAGLQQCVVGGNNRVVWQRECQK